MIGNLFEQAAHLVCGERRVDEAPLDMAILDVSEVLSGRSSWDLSFNETKVFEGEGIPFTFDSGIYYRPNNTNFAAIDSFAVGSLSDTLLFFQMKWRCACPGV